MPQSMVRHTTTFIGKDYTQSNRAQRSAVQHQPYIRKVNYYADEDAGWNRPYVAYGPYYRDRDSLRSGLWVRRKRCILKYVTTGSPTKLTETVKGYVEAIRRVKNEARACYVDNSSLNQLSSNEFMWMMIKDSCLLLVVALFALGGKKQLAFPPKDPLFGDQWDKEQIKLAIASMFYVGNQIPIVVLKELIKQSFFKRVLDTGKWKQPTDLPRKALFDFLIVPMLNTGCGPLNCFLERIYQLQCLNRRARVNQPSDLLHGLRLLVIGPSNNSIDEDDEDDDNDDYYGDCLAIRSATELRQAGIFFKDNKEMGMTGIRFRKDMFNGVLSLPCIFIDSNTKFLIWNLIHYEATQQLSENQRQVCAYFRFMRELIRSLEDVKLLATHGIILADPKGEEELPKILRTLPITRVKDNYNLRHVRNQIHNYSQPSKWGKMRNLLSLVLLLTLLDTIYTIISYHHKPT